MKPEKIAKEVWDFIDSNCLLLDNEDAICWNTSEMKYELNTIDQDWFIETLVERLKEVKK